MAHPTIKAEHVNPFIASTVETFLKMMGVTAHAGKPLLKKAAGFDCDVSGIIGISGGAKGVVSLSFPKETAIRVTNKFIGSNHQTINNDTLDALGELANIVAGNAKKGLSEFNINISLPSVILGSNHQIREPKDVFSFIIPFQTELGAFHLAVSLKSGD